MKKFPLHIVFFFLVVNLFAQNQNNIWYFGYGAGIDFNSGNPVVLTNSSMNMSEGTASIADSLGNILFYTNGIVVWNAQHDTMDNGDSLMGTGTTTQTAIAPKPGKEDSIYYVFTADKNPNVTNGLRYSVIDLKLNAGLGKVVSKNVLLSSSSTEKVTIVTHANGYDFWVLGHEKDTNTFLAYHLSCAGLDTIPVISPVGAVNLGVAGYLKSSTDGSKLALAAYSVVDIFDFNTATGIVSNPLSFPSDSLFCEYGICFSPDNSKLYVGSGCVPGGKLVQYDLLAGTVNDIMNSRTILYSKPCNIVGIDTCVAFGGMQNATDGKLYVAHYLVGFGAGDSLLGVINNPNQLGLNCNYVHDGLDLAGRNTLLSMVNLIETDFNYISCNTSIQEHGLPTDLIIYPNPSKDYLLIESDYSKNLDIKMYNVMGGLILIETVTVTHSKIDISQLPSGMYLIQISTNDLIINKIIVIN